MVGNPKAVVPKAVGPKVVVQKVVLVVVLQLELAVVLAAVLVVAKAVATGCPHHPTVSALVVAAAVVLERMWLLEVQRIAMCRHMQFKMRVRMWSTVRVRVQCAASGSVRGVCCR